MILLLYKWPHISVKYWFLYTWGWLPEKSRMHQMMGHRNHLLEQESIVSVNPLKWSKLRLRSVMYFWSDSKWKASAKTIILLYHQFIAVRYIQWSKAVCCDHYSWEGGISGHHSDAVRSSFNCFHPDGLTRRTADSGSHGGGSTSSWPTCTNIASIRPILYGSSVWVHQPSNDILYAVDKINFHTDATYLQGLTIYRGAYNINYILIAFSILLSNFWIER